MDPDPNGVEPQQNDPQKISAEVYALDMLIAMMRTTAGQLRFRGKLQLADLIDNLLVMVAPGQATTLQEFRNRIFAETYGKTESGIILAGPGAMPKVG